MILSKTDPSYEFLPREGNIKTENEFLTLSFGSLSLLWLLLSGLFLLVESIKLHAPEVFNQLSWLSYGKIHHAAQLSFLGALTQGLLWMGFSFIASAGQLLKRSNSLFFISLSLLNISFIVGIIELLSGNRGHGTLIFPPYSLILFSLGFFFLVPLLWNTLFKIQKLSPSLMFVALSFWTAPFSLATIISLSCGGYLQGAYGAWALAWFSHHFISLFLLPLGIATVLNLAQKYSPKLNQNEASLRFAFWIYTISNLMSSRDLIGTPLPFIPAWLRSIETVGSLFLSFSVLIILHTLFLQLKPLLSDLKKEISFPFFVFATTSLALLGVLKSLLAFQEVNQWVQFSTMTNALQTLLYFGFLMMIFFAWIYHQLPYLLERVWASSSLIQTHFWLSALSTGITILALFVASGLQTYRNATSEIPFLSTVIVIRPLLWIQSLSRVFQFSGALMISFLFLLLLLNWKPNPKNSLFYNPR